MADEELIYISCPSCGGVGTTPVVTGWSTMEDQTCTGCNGLCKVVSGTADGLTDILDKCNDIFNKCEDVLDKLNE